MSELESWYRNYYELDLHELAQSFLDKADEDWTWIDPEDVKRLARAVL